MKYLQVDRRFVMAGAAAMMSAASPPALAEMLLVDGDPVANTKLIEDPEKNFLVIMKDGKIYKNIKVTR